MTNITLSASAWGALLAQSTSLTRAQAFVSLLGAGSVDFIDEDGALIRTVTCPGWAVGATTGSGTTVAPTSYTDTAEGAGEPAWAVFKDGSGVEVFRCSAGSEETVGNPLYRLLASLADGVPLLVGAFAVTLPPPAPVAGVPVNTATPSISGTAIVGATLQSFAGSWTNADSVTRQWMRNGAPIAGATGTTYQITAADEGNTIHLREAATNAVGPAYADSNAAGPVTRRALEAVVPSFDLYRGQTRDLSLHVAGGVPPYKDFSIAGTLPAGVSLNAVTGLLTAAPDAELVTSGALTLTVSDSQVVTPPPDPDPDPDPEDPPPPITQPTDDPELYALVVGINSIISGATF